jgi:Site-specific recombinase XerD
MTTSKSTKNVENDPLFETFCCNRDLSERTRELYINNLQKYVDFANKSLTGLLEEAEDEEDEQIRYRKRKINKYLTDFKLQLDDLDYSHAYKTQIMTHVKAFYNEFDIQLPRPKQRKSRNSRKKETIDEIPTMDEIKKFLNHCNSCYRAIITLGLSSGMGRSEIASLTFKHLYDALELDFYPETLQGIIKEINTKENFIPTWNIKRIKTGNQYFTFSSPENLDCIIDYLDELLFKHPKYKPQPEDTLFRTLRINTPLTPKSISVTIFKINRANGFRKKTINNSYVLHIHTLRKYFATTLEKNKVPHLVTRWLLGHSIDNTTGAYFKADPETLKEDYFEVVDEISTKEVKVKTITTEGYDNLLKKIESLEERQALMDKLTSDPKFMDKINSMENDETK